MNNIKQLRKERKITQEKLAEIIGVSRSTISMYEIDQSEPDFAIAKKLADYFGVSLDYLMDRTDNPIDLSKLKWDNAEYIYISKIKFVKIPILGTIRAGMPTFCDDNYIGEIEIPAEWERSGNKYYALKVNGDSMAPKYQEGDTVILRQSPTCDNGQVCAVLVNGDEATIKKINISQAGITLIPLNPAYEPIFYSNEEVETKPVIIQGVVVRTVRDE